MSGFYPNPTVARINGSLLGTTTPTAANILIADGAAWQSRPVSGDATISVAGVVTINPARLAQVAGQFLLAEGDVAEPMPWPGPPGRDGRDGRDGVRGAPGEDGEDGAWGPPGIAGVAGAPGAMGPPGMDGADGEDGAPGPPGVAGAAGATGATGATGPQGPTGFPGFDGIDGEDAWLPGPMGPTGATGPQGPAGAAGSGPMPVFLGNWIEDGDGDVAFIPTLDNLNNYLVAIHSDAIGNGGYVELRGRLDVWPDEPDIPTGDTVVINYSPTIGQETAAPMYRFIEWAPSITHGTLTQVEPDMAVIEVGGTFTSGGNNPNIGDFYALRMSTRFETATNMVAGPWIRRVFADESVTFTSAGTSGTTDAIATHQSFRVVPSFTADGATAFLAVGAGLRASFVQPQFSALNGGVIEATETGEAGFDYIAHEVANPLTATSGGGTINFATYVGFKVTNPTAATLNIGFQQTGQAVQNRLAGISVLGGNVAPTNTTSIVLELSNATRAFLLSRPANTAAIAAPVDGMVIYDTSTNKTTFRENGVWVTIPSAVTAAVAATPVFFPDDSLDDEPRLTPSYTPPVMAPLLVPFINSLLVHNTLSGLTTGDPHTMYAFLAGRAGGQVFIGGTGATDDLTLQSSSGAGGTSNDIIFLVGNAGGTEAMRILGSGRVGVGKAAPGTALDVTGQISNTVQTIVLANAENNNVAVTASLILLTGGGASATISGFAAPTAAAGTLMIVQNNTGAQVGIENEDVSSTAANRITTVTGGTVNYTNLRTAIFVYDTGTSRWLEWRFF